MHNELFLALDESSLPTGEARFIQAGQRPKMETSFLRYSPGRPEARSSFLVAALS